MNVLSLFKRSALAVLLLAASALATATPIRAFELHNVVFADGATASGTFELTNGQFFTGGITVSGPAGDPYFTITGQLNNTIAAGGTRLWYEKVLSAGAPPIKDVLELDFYDDLAAASIPIFAYIKPDVVGSSYYGHNFELNGINQLIRVESIAFVTSSIAEPPSLALLIISFLSWAAVSRAKAEQRSSQARPNSLFGRL